MDEETKLNLIRKLSAMIDHVGSPAHLGAFEPTEHATVFTSNYFENTMRRLRAEKEVDYSELRRPPLRDRDHWPSLAKFGVDAVRSSFCISIHNLLIKSDLELLSIDRELLILS